jgi:hypothetical protein
MTAAVGGVSALESSPLHASPPSVDESRRDGWARRRAALGFNAKRIGLRGSLVGAAAALLVSLTAPFGVGLVLGKALLLVGAFALALFLRLGVVSIALQESRSRPRRVLLRWIPRLCWLACLPGWALAPVPLANIAAVPATIAANTVLVAAYASWTVSREVRGLRPHVVEWLIVGAALVLFLATLVALALVGALAVWVAGVVSAWWGAAE